MKKIIILAVVLHGVVAGFAQYTLDDQIYDYIDEYKDLAMQEMEQYHVPASITLAQAIYASKVGTNRIAKEANNHFGIMCHTKEWKGESFYETEKIGPEYCYRKYASVQESYRDHSLFLSQRSRYVKLFYFPITDYKSWAHGLQTAGYSGNIRYADTLISIIEKFYLMHYDRKVAQKIGDSLALKVMDAPTPDRITTPEKIVVNTTPEKPVVPIIPERNNNTNQQEYTQERQTHPTPVASQPKEEPKPTHSENNKPATIPSPETVSGKNVFVLDPYAVPFKQAYYPYTSRPTYENNKTKFIIAKAGDTYKKLAAALQLTEKNLRLYNDVYDDSEPIEDEVVYVEMKSSKSATEYHILAPGDTYRYIAQKYGIQLKLIIKRNSGAISSYKVGDKICIGCK